MSAAKFHLHSVVYEVMVDWDGTTRSHAISEGLFSSEFAAKQYLTYLKERAKANGHFMSSSHIEQRRVRYCGAAS